MFNKRKNLWSLAFRLFSRDWRKADLFALLFSLVIATASGSVIFLVIGQMEGATKQQAADALGGDLVVTSSRLLAEKVNQKAAELRLKQTQVTEFASVISNDNGIQLSSVKAIDDAYPLAGRIEISDTPYAAASLVDGAPKQGTIWLAPRTITKLKLEPGQKVELGYIELELAGSISLEPSQASTLFNIAPSAIFNKKDLAASKIVQPGSRVVYRYLFSGPIEQIRSFQIWLKPQLNSSQRLVSINDESPAAGSAIQRAQSYFGLSGLLTLVLLAVAITLATSRYLRRQYDLTALMRCFGLTSSEVTGLFARILLILSLAANLAGLIIGVIFHLLLSNSLTAFISQNIGQPDYTVLIWPVLSSLILLFGIALPAFFQLKRIPPMRVLRRQLSPAGISSWLIWGATLGALLLVMWIQVRDLQLLIRVLVGLVAVCAIFATLAFALLKTLALSARTRSAVVNFSLRQLQHRRGLTVLHLLAFSITLFVMLLLLLVRVELVENWQNNLSEGTPNHFLVNLPQNQQTDLGAFLQQNGIAAQTIYPMVRGRITAIKGVAVKDWVKANGRSHNSLRRELNLSWNNQLPKGNSIVSGKWLWQDSTDKRGVDGQHSSVEDSLVQQNSVQGSSVQGNSVQGNSMSDSSMPDSSARDKRDRALISIEQRTAEALNLGVGDALDFQIGGEPWLAEVSSIRKIDWQTFTPNFYVLAEPGSLDQFDATLITSFYLPESKKQVLTDLVARFPGVSVIELDRIFAEIKSIIDKVSQAIELIMVFVLAAGIALLWATMSFTLHQKSKQAAILRTLGARQGFIQAVFRFEYIWLALLSSTMALMATEAVTALIYQQLFEIDYGWHWQWWLSVPLMLMIFMLAASYSSVRRLSSTPPMSIIRG